jgi:curved DNA-binding protein CbpA
MNSVDIIIKLANKFCIKLASIGLVTSYKQAAEILGVNIDASDEEIKNAYKKLVKKYHPDLNPSANPEKIKYINDAKELLLTKSDIIKFEIEKEEAEPRKIYTEEEIIDYIYNKYSADIESHIWYRHFKSPVGDFLISKDREILLNLQFILDAERHSLVEDYIKHSALFRILKDESKDSSSVFYNKSGNDLKKYITDACLRILSERIAKKLKKLRGIDTYA